MRTCGYELSDVSRLIGKSPSYIRNMLRINALPADVKEMVERGAISASHARTIAVADNPSIIANEIIRDKLSVADTERRVKNGTRATHARAFVNNLIDTQTVRKIETAISNATGASARLVQRRGGRGQIVLSFSSRVHLDEIVEKLTK